MHFPNGSMPRVLLRRSTLTNNIKFIFCGKQIDFSREMLVSLEKSIDFNEVLLDELVGWIKDSKILLRLCDY